MINKKAILFTRPKDDRNVACLHYFSKDLIKNIKDVGEYIVIDLEGEKANREEFESYLKSKEPRLVILNGHGSKDAVCGHNLLPILVIPIPSQNEHLAACPPLIFFRTKS